METEMSESTPKTIPIPREGFAGVQALIEMGEERLAKLAEAQADKALDLSLSQLFDRLTTLLECEQRLLQTVILKALIPLNGLRRSLEMSPSAFLSALDHTISEQAPDEWKADNLESWKQIVPQLGPFFEPDNFFAQTSKAFDLLSERPAVLKSARILTELRPIYDEATTKTVAVLQTNTLVLDYWDGQRLATLHVTLDSGDLDSLEAELARAKKKIQVSRHEASEKGDNFVTYGES